MKAQSKRKSGTGSQESRLAVISPEIDRAIDSYDIVCLDKTRVVLRQDVPPCTDYIHANWVKFDKHDREFIATQVEVEEKFMVYTIELVPEGCSNSHIVKMIHMTNWPDRGVPQSGRHVLRLLRKVVAKLPQKYKDKTQRFMDEYKALLTQEQWSSPQQ
ncbi:Protein-tyrosine phosphatase [Necator americanus]|uniref:Protein-tyrosine phosphatase n=1 Tax=Necator americanus TaxID=51031 RepID=W2TQL7_NECAM|nr:Protein-tyrosine phosphatase [Necator americanus]ETN83307.1 Protein-tyrosine phosphatase [Necator americanus]